MLKLSFTVCALALASCAMDPPAGVAGAASGHGAERHVAAPQVRCDRIKVICIDATGPALMMPSLGLPAVTLPALPNRLTLPR